MGRKVHEPMVELDADTALRVLDEVLSGKREGTPELLKLVRQAQAKDKAQTKAARETLKAVKGGRYPDAVPPASVVYTPTIERREPEPAQEPAPADKQKRKRRKPGRVVLNVALVRRERASGICYAARYIDPVTGNEKTESLTAEGIDNEEAARAWIADKAQTLNELRQAISTGRAVTTRTPVAEAVKRFVKGKQAEGVKPGTLEVYAEATTPFIAWAADNGLAHVEALTGPKLTDFRDWLLAQPAFVQVKGHGLGKGKAARVPGKRKRSPQTVNKKLRALRTVAGFWRERGLCPMLTTDTIRDHLKFQKVKRAAPDFMRAADVRKLLEAVKRHDADLNDGKGHTHPPIGDFLVAALLTGCRFSELANLKWSCVDLVAQEIRLSEHDTKTGHARTIDLDVTPHSLALLARRQLAADGCHYVFGTKTTDERGRVKHHPMSRDVAESARKRLVADFNAPAFYWHKLRKTAGTYLTCAGGIYGGAGAWMAA